MRQLPDGVGRDECGVGLVYEGVADGAAEALCGGGWRDGGCLLLLHETLSFATLPAHRQK